MSKPYTILFREFCTQNFKSFDNENGQQDGIWTKNEFKNAFDTFLQKEKLVLNCSFEQISFELMYDSIARIDRTDENTEIDNGISEVDLTKTDPTNNAVFLADKSIDKMNPFTCLGKTSPEQHTELSDEEIKLASFYNTHTDPSAEPLSSQDAMAIKIQFVRNLNQYIQTVNNKYMPLFTERPGIVTLNNYPNSSTMASNTVYSNNYSLNLAHPDANTERTMNHEASHEVYESLSYEQKQKMEEYFDLFLTTYPDQIEAEKTLSEKNKVISQLNEKQGTQLAESQNIMSQVIKINVIHSKPVTTDGQGLTVEEKQLIDTTDMPTLLKRKSELDKELEITRVEVKEALQNYDDAKHNFEHNNLTMTTAFDKDFLYSYIAGKDRTIGANELFCELVAMYIANPEKLNNAEPGSFLATVAPFIKGIIDK